MEKFKFIFQTTFSSQQLTKVHQKWRIISLIIVFWQIFDIILELIQLGFIKNSFYKIVLIYRIIIELVFILCQNLISKYISNKFPTKVPYAAFIHYLLISILYAESDQLLLSTYQNISFETITIIRMTSQKQLILLLIFISFQPLYLLNTIMLAYFIIYHLFRFFNLENIPRFPFNYNQISLNQLVDSIRSFSFFVGIGAFYFYKRIQLYTQTLQPIPAELVISQKRSLEETVPKFNQLQVKDSHLINKKNYEKQNKSANGSFKYKIYSNRQQQQQQQQQSQILPSSVINLPNNTILNEFDYPIAPFRINQILQFKFSNLIMQEIFILDSKFNIMKIQEHRVKHFRFDESFLNSKLMDLQNRNNYEQKQNAEYYPSMAYLKDINDLANMSEKIKHISVTQQNISNISGICSPEEQKGNNNNNLDLSSNELAYFNQDERNQFNQLVEKVNDETPVINNINPARFVFRKNGINVLHYYHPTQSINEVLEQLSNQAQTNFSKLIAMPTKPIFLLDYGLQMMIEQNGRIMKVLVTSVGLEYQHYLIVHISDITDEPQIRLFGSLKQHYEQLMIDTQQRVKSPLNCIISMLEVTQHSVDQEISNKFMVPALASCKLLLNHVNDLIDSLLIKQEQKIHLREHDFNLKEFLADVIDISRIQVQFRTIELQLNMKEDIPLFVKSDANRLRQVLLNIILSLLKVILNGSVHIIVRQSNNQISIKVSASTYEIKERHFETMKSTFSYLKSPKQSRKEEVDHSSTLILANFISYALSDSVVGLEFSQIQRKNKQFCINITTTFINKNPEFHNQITQRQSQILKACSPKNCLQSQSCLIQNLTRLPITRSSLFSQRQGGFLLQDQIVEEKNSLSDSDGENGVNFQLDNFNIVNQPSFIIEKEFAQDQIIQLITNKKRYNTETFTFGGSGTMYNSLDLNHFALTPFDFIECFEKMERIKDKQFNKKCQCAQVLIFEEQDFDIYGLTFQLDNFGFKSDCILESNLIISQINQMKQNPCCHGYKIVFFSIDKKLENDIKVIEELQQQKDFALIACSQGFQESDRVLIKQLNFDDHIIKPILMDALCFILARWIKL